MTGLSFLPKMLNSYHKSMENENDMQDVQPEAQPESEQESVEESPEIAELKKELAEKEKQVADLARAKRELKREVKQSEPESQNINKQSEGLDYGMKAYLRAEGIEPSEFEFVQKELKESGLKNLDELLSNGYFQATLKETREKKAVEDATPSQTRGSTEAPSTRADYWVQKGELPPNTPENRSLRAEVVNKRISLEKSKSQFSDNPIVG